MSMKERIYYKINIVLILSAVMLMSAGCNFLKPSEADKMNVYLSDKYGDSFTYLTTVDYNGIGSKEACIFSSNRCPDAEIMVRYDTMAGVYIDNYTDIMYEEKFGRVVKATIQDIFRDAPMVSSMTMYRESDLQTAYSFEEYVKLEFPSMTTIVYYDTSGVDINELYGELFEAVDNCGYDMNLVVFLETDEPEIEGFDHNQIASYIQGNTYDELMAVGKPAPY